METIRVSLLDVRDGRAFIHYGPKAKIALCEKAGAPWSDKDRGAKLSPVQREVLSRPEREKIVEGGSGLGKSVTGGCEILTEVMKPGSSTAVVAQRYDHVSAEFKYVIEGLRKLFPHKQSFTRFSFKDQPNYHEYDVDSIWGSSVRGFSVESDEGSALLGKEFSKIVIGEGSNVSPDILDRRIWRALDRRLVHRTDGIERDTGFLTLFTTPRGFDGCSAAEWERVVSQTANKPENLHYGATDFARSVWIRTASVLENPAYDKKVFEARRETMDKTAFEETYLGLKRFKSGAIYREFEESKHVLSLPDNSVIRKMQLGVGFDTGAHFGCILAGLLEPAPGIRQRWVLGEVYTQQETITSALSQVKGMLHDVLGPVFAPAFAGDVDQTFDVLRDVIELWAVDPASQHKLEITEYLDVALYGPKLELLPSIERIRDWLGNGELYYAEGCTWLVEQTKKYAWRAVKTANTRSTASRAGTMTTEPRKGFDHLLDAERLVLLPLDDLGPRIEAPSPTTFAEMWERDRRERAFGTLRQQMEDAENRGGMPC